MSWIKNVHRFAPFSKRLGEEVWIPKTFWRVQIFPTRVLFYPLDRKQPLRVIDFELHGPVSNFMVLYDLERDRIFWSFTSQEGYFAAYIYAEDDSVYLQLKKGANGEVRYRLDEKGRFRKLASGEEIEFSIDDFFGEEEGSERLTLGCSKQQDIQSIFQRGDLCEILPFVFFLSQKGKKDLGLLQGGVGDLLDDVRLCIKKKDRIQLGSALQHVFSVGFSGLFVPQKEDKLFRGIAVNPVKKGASSMKLLGELYVLLKELFVSEKKDHLYLLSLLPREIHAGRFTGIYSSFGTLDLEWRGKMIKKMKIHASKDSHLFLHFPEAIKSLRIRKSIRDSGQVVPLKVGLTLKSNQTYFLDKFFK